MQKQTLSLIDGWQLKERETQLPLAMDFCSSSGQWLSASVPGTVQQDLLTAGCIPDPFVGTHEREVQWIGERTWLYRTMFDVPASLFSATEIVLCFDGLDTLATVWLNGTEILQSTNMFVPYRISVRPLLRAEGNELWIAFSSVLPYGRDQEALRGVKTVWSATDASRVYVRKAQYHYGWDWGPTLLTAGPWRTISLEAYSSRIVDLACHAEVSHTLASANLPVQIELEHYASPLEDNALTATLVLQSPSGDVLDTAYLSANSTHIEHTFVVNAPQLWWPHGYGAQPLYRLVVTLTDEMQVLDQRSIRLGLRRLQLQQQPFSNDEGSSFFFAINNIPLFCGGANWIPADSFLPRVTHEQYRNWITLAVEAHMIMLRVWGGGIYEEDVFYNLCDELGVLVWQDFMFACGIYPGDEDFQASVRAEAEANIRRLRHHPCIALWCGNNEDYPLAASLKTYHEDAPPETDAEGFPARDLSET